MQWAFSSKTKPGDIKVLYNPQDNAWNKLVADDTEDRYGTLLSIKDTPENAEAIRNLHHEVYNENHGEEQRDSEGVRKDYERYRSLSNNLGDDNFDVEEQDANGCPREVHGGESEGDRRGDSRKGARNNGGVKFALKDTVEQSEKVSDSKEAATESPIDQTFYERMVSNGTRVSTKGEQAAQLLHSIALKADELRAMTNKKYAQTQSPPAREAWIES